MGLQRDVLVLASRQGGHVTRAQLVAAGVPTSSIDRRVSEGVFVNAAAGVYQLYPPTSEIDLLLGAILSLPDAVVSHQSAARLLEFPRLPETNPTVTVHSATTHVFRGVTVRRCRDLEPAHRTIISGLPVTNTVRTAFDLAGILEYEEVDEIVEALITARRMQVRELSALVNRLARRGKRGTVNARRLVQERGPVSRIDPTVLERRGRSVLIDFGLPVPIAQFPVPWAPGRRFDGAYRDVHLAIEWDSRSWHQQRKQMQLDRERDRDAAIHGWVVLRFTWDDVVHSPEVVARTVASLLASRKS